MHEEKIEDLPLEIYWNPNFLPYECGVGRIQIQLIRRVEGGENLHIPVKL